MRPYRDGVAVGVNAALCLALLAVWAHSAGYFLPQRPYGEVSREALADAETEFSESHWWPAVDAFYHTVSALQIETSLAPEDHDVCRAIYERIWVNAGSFSHWMRGKLHIYDRNDAFMCGGAA